MTKFKTDFIWNNLQVSGKTVMYNGYDITRLDNFINQLHTEAKDYGVLLSIKFVESTGALYVYLRKNLA